MTVGTEKTAMTSMERVQAATGYKEPDRVPLFLGLTMHGAKELGLSIQEYFSKAEYVVDGQLRMLAKYRFDCLNPLVYAAMEIEAFGGEVVWFEDGPPNVGELLVKTPDDISSLQVPVVKETPCLVEVLKTIHSLRERTGNDTLVPGAVISPFSLPIMQMGFPAYIELIYEQPNLFSRLMAVNQEYCVSWANAQLEAGAMAIGYCDPLASPTFLPSDMYLKTGFKIAQETLARIKGPTSVSLVSSNCLPALDVLAALGTKAVAAGPFENLAEVKAVCQGRFTVLGGLNGVEMHTWTPEEAAENVKEVLAEAAVGGGFVLSDNHEIPWQVSEEVLMSISETVHKWGHYPICPHS